MKIDTKDVYKVELTREEMEVLYTVTLDTAIMGLVVNGYLKQDDPMIPVAQDMHIETSRALYGTDEE